MEEALMTQAQSAEEKARLKKQWTDLAVKQAQEGQWEEAVTTNKNILSLSPGETDALNRLGKAYSELGLYAEARQAYAQTLKYNPGNAIAKKNLDRLALLAETAAPVQAIAERIDTDLYIDETGKTGITALVNLAPPAVVARASVGEKVQLQVNGHRLQVVSSTGDVLGQVEARLANRLIKFMEGGNRYSAAIIGLEPGVVRLRIRESYQHPSMLGQVSFPSQGAGGEHVRGYTRRDLLTDREDDDEIGSEDEYYDGGDDGEELSDVDFENISEPEE
jgi:tetratricopeptide (TPR) repeat protein